MPRFIRRNYMDEKGYKAALAERESSTTSFEAFLKEWCPPAIREELNGIVCKLIYTHQQTVSYQTEHDVDAQDIRVY